MFVDYLYCIYYSVLYSIVSYTEPCFESSLELNKII